LPVVPVDKEQEPAPMLDDQMTFGRLKPELRLRCSIDRGWQPGVWRPSDIKTKPEDRTFAAKLKNLGHGRHRRRLTETPGPG
jgi:hypothetical protein